MTDYYVSAAGSNTSPYDTWAKAATTIEAAEALTTNGDRVFVSHTFVDTGTTIQFLTQGAQVSYYSVDNTGSPEPPTSVTRGATIQTADGSNINLLGFLSFFGFDFISGNAPAGATTNNINIGTTANTNGHYLYFEDCTFELLTNASNQRIFVGLSGSFFNQSPRVTMIDPRFGFNSTGQFISLRELDLTIHGSGSGSIIKSTTKPSVLFAAATSASTRVYCEGADMSDLDAIISVSAINCAYTIKNCRLKTGGSLTTGTWKKNGTEVVADNCDDGATNYSFRRESYVGTVIDETTIKRTAGASNGTTGLSWHMADNGLAEFSNPLVSPPIALWVGVTGSKTFTLEILHDSLTNLQNDQVWLEVEYLGSASYPLGSFVKSRKVTLGTAAPLAAGTGTGNWTTTGLTNPNSQKLTSTVTIGMVGVVLLRVSMAAGASKSIYVCPLVAVS